MREDTWVQGGRASLLCWDLRPEPESFSQPSFNHWLYLCSSFLAWTGPPEGDTHDHSWWESRAPPTLWVWTVPHGTRYHSEKTIISAFPSASLTQMGKLWQLCDFRVSYGTPLQHLDFSPYTPWNYVGAAHSTVL